MLQNKNNNNQQRNQSQIVAGKGNKKKVARNGNNIINNNNNKNKNRNNQNNNRPPPPARPNLKAVQKLGLQRMSTRASETVDKLVIRDPKLRALVRNMISPTEAFCIPRIIPTRPAPKRYYGTVQIPTVQNGSKFKTLVVVKPEPDDFLSFGQESVGTNWFVNCTAGNFTSHYTWGAGEVLTYDSNLLSDPSGKVLKASTNKKVAGYHYSNQKSTWINGFKYYPTNSFSVLATQSMKFNITNLVPSADTNLVFACWKVNVDGSIQVIASKSTAINGGESQTVSTTQVFPAITSADVLGFAFGFYFSDSVTATFGQSSMNVILTADSNPSSIDTGTAVAWTHYTLWDFLDSTNARDQFRSASSYTVTGLSALIQNSTAKFYKNGRIYGGKLQGGTTLPGSFEQVTSMLSTINKKYANYTGLLEKGMHWFFTPDRLQDYEFFNAVNKVEAPPPFMVAALSGGWSVEGPPEFFLTFSINIEVLGQDVGLTYMDSPRIKGLYDGLVSALASVDPFCENPDHLKHIAQTIKKVLTNPDVLSAVGTALQFGLKAAPIVASLL